MTNEQVIERSVSESCISLFEDYAVPLQRSNVEQLGTDLDLLYCGVIGFIGPHVKGSLLLASTREPLGRTAPMTDASQREWIAELTNQLMGRIKNKLIARGAQLHVSTPIVLRGQHLAPIPRGELVPLLFTCDGGAVCVWFDAELSADLDLSQTVEPNESIPEGSSLLF